MTDQELADRTLALLRDASAVKERWSVTWTEGGKTLWQYFVLPAPEAERQARAFAASMGGTVKRH